MAKKKIKLRYEFKKFLVYFVFFLSLFIYAIFGIVKIHKQYEYEKTYEFKILNKGYNKKELNVFLKKLCNKNKDYILEQELNDYYYLIVNDKYYMDKNFLEYITYYENHPDVEINRVIARVNTKAYRGWYTNTKPTDTSKDKLILVNKFNYLDNNYNRDDIVNIPLQYAYYDNTTAQEVLDAYLKMHKDVKELLNVNLMVNSSYRTFEDQEKIYNSYRKNGEEYADSYAARAGYSEHQTGLAIDITSTSNPSLKAFSESEEYKWLKDNSYKYGFILRYPEGKDDITGYNTESWHFRYVGEEVATKIYKEDITFDEYYAFYIEK